MQKAAIVPLCRRYPNIMLRVRRAMRLCDINMVPLRAKYVQLYCAVRTMQGANGHWRKDVARVMAVIMFDWENGGEMAPSWRLTSETKKLEHRMARLLGFQFLAPPVVAAPLGIASAL